MSTENKRNYYEIIEGMRDFIHGLEPKKLWIHNFYFFIAESKSSYKYLSKYSFIFSKVWYEDELNKMNDGEIFVNVLLYMHEINYCNCTNIVPETLTAAFIYKHSHEITRIYGYGLDDLLEHISIISRSVIEYSNTSIISNRSAYDCFFNHLARYGIDIYNIGELEVVFDIEHNKASIMRYTITIHPKYSQEVFLNFNKFLELLEEYGVFDECRNNIRPILVSGISIIKSVEGLVSLKLHFNGEECDSEIYKIKEEL